MLYLFSNALFISTPEYNGFFPPLLKNTIDWLSRSEVEDEEPLKVFKGKVAMIVATSPGKLGGIRALQHLRILLNNVRINGLPNEIGIPLATKNFDKDGNLVDENLKNILFNHISSLKNFIDTGRNDKNC
ncbi:NADPH-dependent FMN reductase [Candidatus Bandiella numerosa]|uniref:NADPH-dependent FMN reductase n=1 Tax=Candidatus Bandiella numerosa TaxID=2570586 RepID=UPI001F2D4F16|nr:NADPH-dependent FMN reductase [Candidatus Bandiella numerosa]